jgi:adenylyl-sulfate kinase
VNDRHITWHESPVPRELFEQRHGQRGCVMWFTGLSASGKSTIARSLEHTLFQRGLFTFVLDGDNVRHGLNADLAFSREDRHENIRRIAHVSELFMQAGLVTLSAFVSPYERDRQLAREIVGNDRFLEVFVDASLDLCKERDPRGLYAKATRGEIENFTGISAPYEAPKNPALVLDTGTLSLERCVGRCVSLLEHKGFIPGDVSP